MSVKRQLLPSVIGLLLLVVQPSPVWAEDHKDAFVVKSVSTQLDETVYFLNAVFEMDLPDYISTSIEQGFDLPLFIEIAFYQQNSFWFDRQIIYIKQQYQLTYHTLLDSVSVLNVNSGLRQYFPSLHEALEHLSVILNFPVLDKNNLISTETYEARLRIGIDQAELPIPLKSSSLWQNDWELVSDWYKWEINP